MIWEEYGLGSLLDGYLRLINPNDYQEILNDTYFRGNESIPIMITAFGDVLTLEEGQYIGMVNYKYGTFVIMAKNFKRFLQKLEDEYFLGKYFQVPKYVEAKNKFGDIATDECFGYVPLLGLGGSDNVDNLKKVKSLVHIELISQLVGKIGM